MLTGNGIGRRREKGWYSSYFFEIEKLDNNLSVVSWNIAGIRKLGSLKDYLREFDVIALQHG